MQNLASISGQWYGYFTYGEEYGETLKGERVLFSFLIEELASGQFEGKCIETEGIGFSKEISTIHGYIEDGFISFTKEYKTYKTIDEDGNDGLYEDRLPPRISYKGKFDPFANKYCGSWEIWTDEIPYGEGTFINLYTGRWEIGRNGREYGFL